MVAQKGRKSTNVEIMRGRVPPKARRALGEPRSQTAVDRRTFPRARRSPPRPPTAQFPSDGAPAAVAAAARYRRLRSSMKKSAAGDRPLISGWTRRRRPTAAGDPASAQVLIIGAHKESGRPADVIIFLFDDKAETCELSTSQPSSLLHLGGAGPPSTPYPYSAITNPSLQLFALYV